MPTMHPTKVRKQRGLQNIGVDELVDHPLVGGDGALAADVEQTDLPALQEVPRRSIGKPLCPTPPAG